MLVPLAVLTLIIGNFVAIAQSNLKRMLAYSTIANVGFILLGFITGTPRGLQRRALLHARLHSCRAGLIRRHPAREPPRLRGGRAGGLQRAVRARSAARGRHDGAHVLHRRRSALHRILGEAADHPGAVGDAARVYSSSFAASASVVGAFYYLRIVKLMYFDAPAPEIPKAVADIRARA